MANTQIKIAMDNRVKPGQQTRDEVLAALLAQGIPVQAAEPTFDPITGQLVQTFVNLPDASAEQAQQVIDDNAGVAIQTILPTPMTINTMEEFNLPAALPYLDLGGPGYNLVFGRCDIGAVTPAADQCGLSFITYPGTYPNAQTLYYTDAFGNKTYGPFLASGGSVNPNPQLYSCAMLTFQALAPAKVGPWPGTNIVIPNDTMTLKINGVTRTLHFVNHENITVEMPPSGQNWSAKTFYMDSEGRLYLQRDIIYSQPWPPYLNYEESVNQNGVY